MNERQQIAIQYPSASAVDSMHARFQRTVDVRGRTISTIVTLNK